MKKYAKIGNINFICSSSGIIKNAVDVTVKMNVDGMAGPDWVIAETNIVPDDVAGMPIEQAVKNIVRIITDQISIAMREAKEL